MFIRQIDVIDGVIIEIVMDTEVVVDGVIVMDIEVVVMDTGAEAVMDI